MNSTQTSKPSIVISRILGIISSILGYFWALLFIVDIGGGAYKRLYDIIVAIIIFAIPAALLIKHGITAKGRIKRFKRYVGIISVENKTSLTDIASACSQSVDFVTKDLQIMINKKFFVNAYIDRDNNEIVLEGKNNSNINIDTNSDETVESKTVTCKNCGASNKILADSVGECEYCGSPIS